MRCKVIPVILRECLWTWTELGDLQAVMDNDRPIEETKGYGKVAKAIATIVSTHHKAIEVPSPAMAQQKKEAEVEKRRAAKAEKERVRKEEERQAAKAKKKKEDTSNLEPTVKFQENPFLEQEDFSLRHLGDAHVP